MSGTGTWQIRYGIYDVQYSYIRIRKSVLALAIESILLLSCCTVLVQVPGEIMGQIANHHGAGRTNCVLASAIWGLHVTSFSEHPIISYDIEDVILKILHYSLEWSNSTYYSCT